MLDYFYSLEHVVMYAAEYATWTSLWHLCNDMADEENQ